MRQLRMSVLVSAGAALVVGLAGIDLLSAQSQAALAATPPAAHSVVPVVTLPPTNGTHLVSATPPAPPGRVPVCSGWILSQTPVMVGTISVGTLSVYREWGSGSWGTRCAMVQVDRDGVAAAQAAYGLVPELPAPVTVPPAGVAAPDAPTITPDTPQAPAVVPPAASIPPTTALPLPAAPAQPGQPVPPSASTPVRTRLWMYAAMQQCEATAPGGLCRDMYTTEDEGMFKFYAGPVRMNPRGHCLRVEGRIVVGPNVEGYAETQPRAGFCG